MNNKQIVITLHEGCLDPENTTILSLLNPLVIARHEVASSIVKAWLLKRLQNDPDCLLIDKIEVIDCDCEVEA